MENAVGLILKMILGCFFLLLGVDTMVLFRMEIVVYYYIQENTKEKNI